MPSTRSGGLWIQAVSGCPASSRGGVATRVILARAVAEWLNGGPEHLNRFETASAVVRALFGAYKSMLLGRRVELPATLTDDEWQVLMDRIRKPEG